MQQATHSSPRRLGHGRRPVAALIASTVIVSVLAASLVAAGRAGSASTVSLRKTSLGLVLVAGKTQHTLYLFRKDHNGKSSCSGGCAQFWPPLLTQAKPTAGKGVSTGMLGTTRRANGDLQVTYNHHPLYGYALDKKPGQTNGQGLSAFGAKWYVVNAGGNAITKTASATTSTPTTTTNPYP